MFKKLTLEEFLILSGCHQKIAVYKEISANTITSSDIFQSLRKNTKDISFLETDSKENNHERYSFFCFDTIAEINSFGRDIHIKYENNSQHFIGDPFHTLRELQKKMHCEVFHNLPGYVGGMVGCISYDAIRLIEKIPDNNLDCDHVPDIFFRFFRNHITLDYRNNKIIIITVVSIDGNPSDCYNEAMMKIEKICDELYSYKTKKNCVKVTNNRYEKKIDADVDVDVDDKKYYEMVRNAKKYITRGDIFQVVLSRQYRVDVSTHPFEIYCSLKASNPSPYMFYIEHEDFVITGSSPELLVSKKGKFITSRPLAGTKARGGRDDNLLEEELMNDSKEVAEHMMLVDLSRNDIGRISIPGSVKVTKLKKIEKFSKVIHISSTVQGELKDGKDVFDVIKATFPAGTLTGAPKIRAMELIDELEETRRGIYGGAICAIDADGNLDSCIAIRMAMIKDGSAFVRAGAGIVYDSIPKEEANETFQKARAVIEAILAVKGEES